MTAPPPPLHSCFSLYVARTSSQSSLDSLELTRYSDDGSGRHGDERVAVLEFELRKSQETIKSLRASLTKASSGRGCMGGGAAWEWAGLHGWGVWIEVAKVISCSVLDMGLFLCRANSR